ncbi:ATP-binding cassette domain-containing protein, partial [Staphylococcus aureus]|uniref:ATP-binding cassette domain-containing protein n=1 Tax=Staphylococcus aureus TaxID=1280 RepID=UPI0038B27FC3
MTEDVWSELVFPLENLGLSASEIDWRVGEMVHFMGISSWLSRTLSSLSAGQKQLVQLMACLITRPDVLILDNPLT